MKNSCMGDKFEPKEHPSMLTASIISGKWSERDGAKYLIHLA